MPEDDTHQKLLQAVQHYQMPPPATSLLEQHKPLMISGITGAGKTNVGKYIQGNSTYRHVVTHTTRPLRAGEVNGHDYWFVKEAEMLRLIAAQQFVETKLIHADTVYGTSLKAYQDVLDSGYQPLQVIDVQGIEEILKHVPSLRPVFILPPSFEVWMDRLNSRGVMSDVERIKRLRSAHQELDTVLKNRSFVLVVNNQIPTVATEILSGSFNPAIQARNRELAQELINHIQTY